MNIQKYFSTQKIMSRREAEKLLRAGKIKLNGRIVTDYAVQIDPSKDKIEIIGQIDDKMTILVNKPAGISSSKIPEEGKNIFDLLPQFKHLSTIGRLDKDSEGLILLSNDGILTNIITGQRQKVEKEYLVQVRERVTPTKITALSQGMILEDGPTLPAKAMHLGEHTFSIILVEGRNHQIRRMANKVKLTIVNLKRVRVGPFKLENIPVGDFREISTAEVQNFKADF